MEQIKTDLQALHDYFNTDISVEDIAKIFEQKLWDLVLFELNNETKSSTSLSDDIYCLHCFVEALKSCKTIKNGK